MRFLYMTGLGLCAMLVLAVGAHAFQEQEAETEESQQDAEYRAGKNLMPTKVYSEEEDQKVLEMFQGLRVADVSDGMDKVGLQNIGLMSPEIHALWRDTEHYTHRFVGIAVTARYVPTQRPPAGHMTTEQFDKWIGEWYSDLSPEPFVPLLRKGSAVVIEDTTRVDVGTIGSLNSLVWKLHGCVGIVTSATARDTDEIAAQGIPLYFKHIGRGTRPGRNEVESVNRPVVVGGVLVMPGDVVLADGDGVIVVPRQHAEEVADYAWATLDKDKPSRRALFEKLGMPLDDSVK